MVAGTDQQAVDDGTPFPSFGASNKKPILAPHRQGADVSWGSGCSSAPSIDLDLAVVDVCFDVVSLVEEVAHGFAKRSGGTSCFFVAEVEAGFLEEFDEGKAVVFAVADFAFFTGLFSPQDGFDLVKFSENFEEPFGKARAGFEGFLKFTPNVGEAGGTAGFLAPGFLKAALLWVNLVGVACKDAFEVLADPVKKVMVIATEGPVEDDVAIQAFVEPEAPASGGAGFVGIAEACLGFVRSQVSALEHVALHEINEDLALVGEVEGSVAHRLLRKRHSVAALVEFALAIVREMVEEAIADDFKIQSPVPW